MKNFGLWVSVLVICDFGSHTLVQSAEPVTSEQVTSAVAELEMLAQRTLQSTGVPGIAIAVVHKEDVILAKGFGVREAGKPERIDASTVFQVASVSKPIASTVLAVLVGEGAINWDDRVIDRDPDFRMFDPWVTRELRLRDLLCHRSGLPDHCGDLLEDIGYDRKEVLFRLRYQKPDSSFRSQYAYTNFGYTEACVAAARATGKDWEDLVEAKLYKPLGMASTSSRFADFAKAKNRAALHVKVGGKWFAKNVRQPDAQSPAGGVSSNLEDLTRWMRLQLAGGEFAGKQLVAEAALAETHRPQMILSFDPSAGRMGAYGLGWNVGIDHGGRVFWRHSGAFSLGMRTEVALLPSEQLGIIVLSNAAPTGVPEGLTESFFDYLLDGKLSRDWVEFANRMFAEDAAKELGREIDYSKPPASKSPPLASAAYVGKYRNDLFGTVEVAQVDGALMLQLGPRQMQFALRHWDRDLFIFQPTGESAGGPSGVRFTIGADSKASQLRVDYLDIHGEGVFVGVAAGK